MLNIIIYWKVKKYQFHKINKNRKLEMDLKFKGQYNETLDYLKRDNL